MIQRWSLYRQAQTPLDMWLLCLRAKHAQYFFHSGQPLLHLGVRVVDQCGGAELPRHAGEVEDAGAGGDHVAQFGVGREHLVQCKASAVAGLTALGAALAVVKDEVARCKRSAQRARAAGVCKRSWRNSMVVCGRPRRAPCRSTLCPSDR